MQPPHAARLLITAYLREVTSLLADAAKIQELARNFTSSVADRHIRIKETALLDGFSSKLDEIDCGRGYWIRRLPPNEYARYIDLYSYSDRLRWFLREFAIEKLTDIDLTKPIPAPEGWPFQDPMIGHIVTSLRILGPGKVAAPEIAARPADPGAVSIFAEISRTIMNPLQTCPNEYVFPDDSIGDLKTVLAFLADNKLPNELRIAVSRLNSAVERQNVEDSYIDHIVALEAVYGDGSTKDQFLGSLTFKMAMRAAIFLEANRQKRKATVNALKEAQTLRGKVVHGTGSLKTKDNELICKVANLARNTVRSAILDVCAKDKKISGAYFDDLLLEEQPRNRGGHNR